MPDQQPRVTLAVESDTECGDDVLHIFPTWQTHDPIATCACHPEVIVNGPVVKVYWHNWKEPADADY